MNQILCYITLKVRLKNTIRLFWSSTQIFIITGTESNQVQKSTSYLLSFNWLVVTFLLSQLTDSSFFLVMCNSFEFCTYSLKTLVSHIPASPWKTFKHSLIDVGCWVLIFTQWNIMVNILPNTAQKKLTLHMKNVINHVMKCNKISVILLRYIPCVSIWLRT